MKRVYIPVIQNMNIIGILQQKEFILLKLYLKKNYYNVMDYFMIVIIYIK